MYVRGNDIAQKLRIRIVALQKVFGIAIADAHIVHQNAHIQTSCLLAYLVVDIHAAGKVHIDDAYLDAELLACKYATELS